MYVNIYLLLSLAQQCPPLTSQENGWMNCSHPHSLFSYGSQCFLGCKAGFEITGEPGMMCSASGNWSQEMPSCTGIYLSTKMECSNLVDFSIKGTFYLGSIFCNHKITFS